MNILVKLDVPTVNVDINYLYEIVLLLYHFHLAGFLVHIYKISKKKLRQSDYL